MRLVIASCSVDYSGRLDAHLPRANRVLMLKADGSVLVHSDGGSYKPLNWMTAPARLSVSEPDPQEAADGVTQIWEVRSTKTDDRLVIRLFEVLSDVAEDLGADPGLTKDGVLAAHQAVARPQYLDLLGQELLEVGLHPVLLSASRACSSPTSTSSMESINVSGSIVSSGMSPVAPPSSSR